MNGSDDRDSLPPTPGRVMVCCANSNFFGIFYLLSWSRVREKNGPNPR